MKRDIETPLGMVRLTGYRDDRSHPDRKVLVVTVQDLHTLDSDVAPVVVNRIPVQLIDWMEVELAADLSNEKCWRGKGSTINRLDQAGYNNATDGQKSKVWRAVREAVIGAFSDPELIFEVILADQKAVVERKQKAVEQAEAALLLARAELLAVEGVASDMERMLVPFDGDPDGRDAFEAERRRTFGLSAQE